MTEKHLSSLLYSELVLPEVLQRGILDSGFVHCTPIQAESLPILLSGQDVAGQAQTGTGKTAAFLVATFHRLLTHYPPEGREPNHPRALILAPTRELAIQIHADAQALGRHAGLRLALAYGGTGYDEQRERITAGVDVLIGTPGRIIDYFRQHVFSLKSVQVLVLDEADRMFDLGFIKDIRFLLNRLPPPDQRLNMLFSATLSERVNELAYEHMHNPQVVKIESDKLTVDSVREQVYFPANPEKIPLLIGLMRSMQAVRTLVFVNTRHGAERVALWLRTNDFGAAVISGDVPQKKREQLLGMFKDGRLAVLVATDVAARGLHIPDVSHVINYDLPQGAEDYVHRVGRTARAGASGDAISFACETYAFHLGDIESYVGHKIEVRPVDESTLAPADSIRAPERHPRGLEYRDRAHRGDDRHGRRDDRPRKRPVERRSELPRGRAEGRAMPPVPAPAESAPVAPEATPPPGEPFIVETPVPESIVIQAPAQREPSRRARAREIPFIG
jgi:ATP-dependent RNA helicase RhlB